MEVTENYERVLHQLEIESRRSYTKIGRRIEVSKQSVSYAVKSMEEDDIIKSFYPLVDYSKLGFNAFLVLFRLENYSESSQKDVKEEIKANPMNSWVDTVSGGWDIAAYFVAPNNSKFNKKFKIMLSDLPSEIKDYEVMSSVVIHEMGRKYLRDYSLEDEIEDKVIGGDRKRVEIDDTMHNILFQLNDDPKKPSVEIAQECDVTAKTVANRISDLREKKLVRAVRPVISLKETSISSKLLFLKLDPQESRNEDDLKDYCDKHSNVVQLIKLLGDHDMMLRIEADERRLENIVNSIREQFGDMIRDHSSFEVMERSDKAYLPDNYLDIYDKI